MSSVAIWRGWQVARGFLEFVGISHLSHLSHPFPTFPLTSPMQAHNLPAYFISLVGLWSITGAQHSTSPPGLLPQGPQPMPSSGGGRAARLPLHCPIPVVQLPEGSPASSQTYGFHQISSGAPRREGDGAGALRAPLPAGLPNCPARLLAHKEISTLHPTHQHE